MNNEFRNFFLILEIFIRKIIINISLAIRKLEKINFVVGNVENMGEDPVLSYSSNFYDNLEKICDSRFKKQISIIVEIEREL